MSTTSFCNSNHILVGLGGTGGKILRAFKMRMFEEFHDDEERKKLPVALLYVDSTDEMMPQDGKSPSSHSIQRIKLDRKSQIAGKSHKSQSSTKNLKYGIAEIVCLQSNSGKKGKSF